MNLSQKLLSIEIQRKKRVQQNKTFIKKIFQFSVFDIAFAVRQTMYEIVIKFDTNGDMKFSESQIKRFLVQILHESESQVQYFIRNVFRYDSNKDGQIQYDQLVNFVMEQHLGQMAIQRLHRKKKYHKGSLRIMNCSQFLQTIIYALSFVNYKPNEAHVESIFKSVDKDNDGFISYEDYFKFLIEYFGSKSTASNLITTNTVIKELSKKMINIDQSHRKEEGIVDKYTKYEKEQAFLEDATKIISQVHNYLQTVQITFSNQNQANGKKNISIKEIQPKETQKKSILKNKDQQENTKKNNSNQANVSFTPNNQDKSAQKTNINQGNSSISTNSQNISASQNNGNLSSSNLQGISASKINANTLSPNNQGISTQKDNTQGNTSSPINDFSSMQSSNVQGSVLSPSNILQANFHKSIISEGLSSKNQNNTDMANGLQKQKDNPSVYSTPYGKVQQQQLDYKKNQDLSESFLENQDISNVRITFNSKSISNLVLSQLKLMIFSFDSKQKGQISQTDAWNFCRKYFNYIQADRQQLLNRLNIRQRLLSYQQASKIVIRQQIHFIFSMRNYVDSERVLTCCEFSELCIAVCSIVRHTPIINKLRVYYVWTKKSGKAMTVGLARQIITHIFDSI